MKNTSIFCIAAVIAFAANSPALADDLGSRLNKLEDAVNVQSETINEQQKTIEKLKEQLKAVKPEDSSQQASKLTGLFGGSLMSNPYISVAIDAKGYVSNLKNDELNSRGIPGFTTEGHDLHNGFDVDAAEIFVFAPVDPYFNLYANIPINADGAVLEEAYFVTTALPEAFR